MIYRTSSLNLNLFVRDINTVLSTVPVLTQN